jgi:pyruvate,water dikinase
VVVQRRAIRATVNNKPKRYIYFFGAGQAEGGSEIKHLVGGKGASLADMTRAGLNVPPGFTISAECCESFFRAEKRWPDGLRDELLVSLTRLERVVGRRFGRGDHPLLVSVRSGAAQSMPGMMDTVLNVGLHPDGVRAVGKRTGNPRAAWEAYRHFLAMFGRTVGGIDENVYTQAIGRMLKVFGQRAEAGLDAYQMEALCDELRLVYRQYVGFAMPLEPWDQLRQAINAVFASWHNERAVTYRKHHDIQGLLGTAVTIQTMCPSEVSGVLFTANPVDPGLPQIVIESSFGLGEAIVLGKVTPDRFILNKQSLQVIERTISRKELVIAAVTRDGRGTAGQQEAASLTGVQVEELARLGLRVEAHFQGPCDIEWAWAEGQFWLLQARPIRRTVATERERVRREEIEALRRRADPAGTVWSRYNLAEILPAPTPMTWAIVRRFMSGLGGYGQMLRSLGYDPDPIIDTEGFIDLVCGRPYVNLSREPKLYFRDFPYGYRFAALKANPQKAIYPQPEILSEQRSGRFILRFPVIFYKMIRNHSRMKRQSRYYADHLRQTVFPQFRKEVEAEKCLDLTRLPALEVLTRLYHWIARTLKEFAQESLKPTVFAALSLEHLKQGLGRTLGPDLAMSSVRSLMAGVHPDPEADLPAALRALTEGSLKADDFLHRFGHRGPQEMELAQPRWSEIPERLPLARQFDLPPDPERSPEAERQSARAEAVQDTQSFWKNLVGEAKLSSGQAKALEQEFHKAQTYLALRETGKHYLMMGYALIRRLLLELDRRARLEGNLFYLTPEELPRLVSGENLDSLIDERRQRRDLLLQLDVPAVLFSDDLDALGRPVSRILGAAEWKGTPLSAGVAEAFALVVEDPTQVLEAETGFVLVCPSTDPAWLPLFLRAKGLIMETGGMLSHGAIVAREFNLPAVAGIPNIHKQLRSGQRVRVDGNTGVVHVFDEDPTVTELHLS